MEKSPTVGLNLTTDGLNLRLMISKMIDSLIDHLTGWAINYIISISRYLLNVSSLESSQWFYSNWKDIYQYS